MSRMASFSTRVNNMCSNILDLVLTDQPEYISSLSGNEGITDHKAVHCNLVFEATERVSLVKTIRLNNKGNYEPFNTGLSNYFSVFLHKFVSRNANENWCKFKNKLIELIEIYVPSTTISY